MKAKILLILIFVTLVSAQMFPGPGVKGYAAAGITPINTGNAMCVGADSGTISFDSTGANFIIIGGGSHPAGALTISDNKSNTYTALTIVGNASAPTLYSFYVANATTGSGHVITIHGLFPGACAATFSGVSISTPIQSQTGVGDQSGSATISPGSQTPASNGSLIFTFVNTDIGPTATSIDSSFIISGKLAGVAATSYGANLAYLIQSTAGIVTPTWTMSTTSTYDSNVVTAK